MCRRRLLAASNSLKLNYSNFQVERSDKTDHTALYTAEGGSIQPQEVRKTDHTALYTAEGGSIQQQEVCKTDHTALYTAEGGSRPMLYFTENADTE